MKNRVWWLARLKISSSLENFKILNFFKIWALRVFLAQIIDLLMGLFRGAVFRHGGGALKQPIKQQTETPTSTLALMGRFPSLMGRFPTLMGRFTDFRPKGPFYLLKIHWKTAH